MHQHGRQLEVESFLRDPTVGGVIRLRLPGVTARCLEAHGWGGAPVHNSWTSAGTRSFAYHLSAEFPGTLNHH